MLDYCDRQHGHVFVFVFVFVGSLWVVVLCCVLFLFVVVLLFWGGYVCGLFGGMCGSVVPLTVFFCVCLFGASFSPYNIGMLLNTCVYFQFKLVTNMTGNLGRKQRFSAFVITGNKNGLAGKLS